MGGTGVSLKISGNGDPCVLGAAIWNTAHEIIHMDVDLHPWGDLAYYTEDEGRCTAQDDSVTWWFSNPGGCCTRSQQAWMHWFQRVLSWDWYIFTQIAAEHGLAFVSGPPDLDELAREGNFITLRDDLWMAEEDGLYGDNAHIPLAELTADERVLHAEALQRCRCPMCAPKPARQPS